jgi:hypothetical protein
LTDDEVIEALRSRAVDMTPAEAMGLLVELAGEELTQFRAILYMTKAFKIPLRICREASTSSRVVGSGGLDDAALDALLGPWFSR